MIRFLVLGTLLSTLCTAQFSSLVTNDDGSVLYFITNLKQAGTEQSASGKIFVSGANGVHLYSAIARVPGDLTSNYYDLEDVDVSGDGRLVASTARRDCLAGGTPCQRMNNLLTTVDGAAAANRSFPGGLRLSANGKFGLQIETTLLTQTHTIVDPSTGTIVASPATHATLLDRVNVALPPGRVIADDGTAAYSFNSSSLWTYSASLGLHQVFTVAKGSSVDGPLIDAAASQFVYVNHASTGVSIRRLDLKTGEETIAFDGFPRPVSTLTLSASKDLTRILFLAPDSAGRQQAFLLTGSPTPQALTNDPSGIEFAALSGNGAICYLLTNQGSILRVDLGNNTSQQIVGRTAVITGAINISPGALVNLTGFGFADSSAAVSGIAGTSLNGFRLRVDDAYAAILAVTPTSAQVQIPWSLDTANLATPHTVQVETGADSSFVSDAPVFASPSSPISFPNLVVHSGFDSLVTHPNPALAGEIVHIYATGLGAVDPPVALGTPAPTNPLAKVNGGVNCSAVEGAGVGAVKLPVTVYYAGLAPGLIGYYQIDFQLPVNYKPTIGVQYTADIECRVGTSSTLMQLTFPFQPN